MFLQEHFCTFCRSTTLRNHPQIPSRARVNQVSDNRRDMFLQDILDPRLPKVEMDPSLLDGVPAGTLWLSMEDQELGSRIVRGDSV